jgi:hypothetical protein
MLTHEVKHPVIPADAVLRTPPMLKVEKKHIRQPASPAKGAKRPSPAFFVCSGNHCCEEYSSRSAAAYLLIWQAPPAVVDVSEEHIEKRFILNVIKRFERLLHNHHLWVHNESACQMYPCNFGAGKRLYPFLFTGSLH